MNIMVQAYVDSVNHFFFQHVIDKSLMHTLKFALFLVWS